MNIRGIFFLSILDLCRLELEMLQDANVASMVVALTRLQAGRTARLGRLRRLTELAGGLRRVRPLLTIANTTMHLYI